MVDGEVYSKAMKSEKNVFKNRRKMNPSISEEMDELVVLLHELTLIRQANNKDQ